MSVISSFGYISNNAPPRDEGDGKTSEDVGTVVPAGVTVTEWGTAQFHTTEFDFGTPASSTTTLTIAGAGQQNDAIALYTFPADVNVMLNSAYMRLSLQAAGGNSGDTPDVGIGWVATTAEANLGVLIGIGMPVHKVFADCNGTEETEITTSGAYGAGKNQTLYLNAVDTAYTGADTITVSGKITLEWVALHK